MSKEQKKLLSELLDKANKVQQQILKGEKKQGDRIVITEEMINQRAKEWGVTFEEAVKLWNDNIDTIKGSYLGNTKKGPNTAPKITDINDVPTQFGDTEGHDSFFQNASRQNKDEG